MSHTFTSPATVGLFQAIVEDPFDDVPRLLLADVLEEAGEGERAEFVRVQVELAKLLAGPPLLPVPTIARKERIDTLRRRERELLGRLCVVLWQGLPFGSRCVLSVDPAEASSLPVLRFRRGFIASVTLTMADWCRTVCVRADLRPHSPHCAFCNVTGFAGGHGPALVKAAPLEQVILSDREPGRYMGSWAWFLPGGIGSTASQIPGYLFDLIEKKHRQAKQEALDDLSRAALHWARQEAGLPALS